MTKRLPEKTEIKIPTEWLLRVLTGGRAFAWVVGWFEPDGDQPCLTRVDPQKREMLAASSVADALAEYPNEREEIERAMKNENARRRRLSESVAVKEAG